MRNLVRFVKLVCLRGGQHRFHLGNRLVAERRLVQLVLHHRQSNRLNRHCLQLRVFHHHVHRDALLPERFQRGGEKLPQNGGGVGVDFRNFCGNLLFGRLGRKNAAEELLGFRLGEGSEVVVNRGPLLFFGNHLVALEGLTRDDVDVGGILLFVQHPELLRPRHRLVGKRGGVADAAVHERGGRVIGRTDNADNLQGKAAIRVAVERLQPAVTCREVGVGSVGVLFVAFRGKQETEAHLLDFLVRPRFAV